MQAGTLLQIGVKESQASSGRPVACLCADLVSARPDVTARSVPKWGRLLTLVVNLRPIVNRPRAADPSGRVAIIAARTGGLPCQSTAGYQPGCHPAPHAEAKY